jgi:Ala-tRNA(Pro) deacylase
MTIPTNVLRCLEDRGANFEIRAHPAAVTATEIAQAAHVSGDIVVKAVVLKDDKGLVVALLPATHVLLVRPLAKYLGRPLELADEADFQGRFPDCDTGAVPALTLPYDVTTVVDSVLLEAPRLFLESGSHRDLVALSGDDFRRLYADSDTLVFSAHKP